MLQDLPLTPASALPRSHPALPWAAQRAGWGAQREETQVPETGDFRLCQERSAPAPAAKTAEGRGR